MQTKQETATKYKINSARLMTRLQDLAKIGQNKNGGIDRQLASEADAEARKWLINCWRDELGLLVKIDPIANLWAENPESITSKKPIVLGSHHDTVPNGGMFDGALGVLMATEVMQTLFGKPGCPGAPAQTGILYRRGTKFFFCIDTGYQGP